MANSWLKNNIQFRNLTVKVRKNPSRGFSEKKIWIKPSLFNIPIPHAWKDPLAFTYMFTCYLSLPFSLSLCLSLRLSLYPSNTYTLKYYMSLSLFILTPSLWYYPLPALTCLRKVSVPSRTHLPIVKPPPPSHNGKIPYITPLIQANPLF